MAGNKRVPRWLVSGVCLGGGALALKFDINSLVGNIFCGRIIQEVDDG